jgi:hypothetical protein
VRKKLDPKLSPNISVTCFDIPVRPAWEPGTLVVWKNRRTKDGKLVVGEVIKASNTRGVLVRWFALDQSKGHSWMAPTELKIVGAVDALAALGEDE